MCGIAGIAGGAPPDPAVLERMAASMAHRGPDGQGVWSDDTVGFAFRRLAIIDLHERANQPMHFERWHLVFNGEIYNYIELRAELVKLGHRFATEGDTEVLLHAWAQWGEGALDRLNGMFGFAVWDEQEQCLTLARDRFGEKPLYYAETGERLAFASDIPALILAGAASGAPRTAALAPYLTRGLMPEPGSSFFAGVRSVPAAHVLRWRQGASEVSRYWTPAHVTVPGRYEDAVEALGELLGDAVRLRLRSDVPVGTSLSGGVDSSAVVGLAARLPGEHGRHAFTATFPGFERDEWRYAAAVAARAEVAEHHAVRPDSEELLEDVDRLILDHQEPVGGSSIYAQWRVMRAARDAGVTVLLDGQGGDELFGGYAGIGGYALRSRGSSRLAANVSLAGLREGARSILIERLPRTAARAYRRRIASPYAAPAQSAEGAYAEQPELAWARGEDPLRRELMRECFLTSLPPLLRYADRSSMASSREVRLPLLDPRVAEFAVSLPASFLYEPGTTKRILRDAVKGVVPGEVLERRDKVGFETPQARWLNAPAFVERIAESLLDGRARARGLYDTDAIEADVKAGRWRDARAIWWALNTERWLCMFERGAGTSAPSPSGAAAVEG